MSNLLKDIAVLLFSVGEEIEKKAEEIKVKRQERYKDFENKIHDSADFKDDIKSCLKDEIEKITNTLKKFSGNMGLATKDEVEDLKKKIDELSSKLDPK